MANLSEQIRKELRAEDRERKALSFTLPAKKINDLDLVIRNLNYVNSDSNFSRQKLVELAIDNVIEECKEILRAEGIDDLNAILTDECEADADFDTVIFPAHRDGFNSVFIGEKKWYYVRIAEDKIDKIKYIACYVGQPVSAITHYAKVDEFVFDAEEGKYIVKFDGSAIELENSIPLGTANPASVRANRYVKLDTLLNASTYADLT